MSWKDAIKKGAILAFLNLENNAPHHSSELGKWIQYVQSFVPSHDARVTHVGVIKGWGEEAPEEGYTQMRIKDILFGETVGDRIVERNYGIEIHQLKEKMILNNNPKITSEMLMNKALEVAEQFEGIQYDRTTLAKIVFFPSDYLWKDDDYTQWICQRFKIDTEAGTFCADKVNDTLVCPELVILSYQIAWLLLAGKGAENKPLPDFLNIHAHSSVAALVKFLRENECFAAVDPIHIHSLRYSGTPHENDPPVPPAPEPLFYRPVRFSVASASSSKNPTVADLKTSF